MYVKFITFYRFVFSFLFLLFPPSLPFFLLSIFLLIFIFLKKKKKSFTIYPRLALNSWTSCLRVLNTVVTPCPCLRYGFTAPKCPRIKSGTSSAPPSDFLEQESKRESQTSGAIRSKNLLSYMWQILRWFLWGSFTDKNMENQRKKELTGLQS